MSRMTFVRRTLFTTAGLAAMAVAGSALAAPAASGGIGDQVDKLCDRTEFTRREIRRIQRRAEFPEILAYTLDVCPAVGAVLADGATSTVSPAPGRTGPDEDRRPSDGGGRGGGETGGGY